ncbi:hypothetical protein PSE10B_49450 [Pseudomonas amygdali pv. eriobotryae]|nr:hypothetical protein BSNN_37870 [Bacillus subtilis subsp. natto]GFZ68423.1 hypothetical protein PSE10B_49450 [Pseudomonas amygdali pv. eriobotryae]
MIFVVEGFRVISVKVKVLIINAGWLLKRLEKTEVEIPDAKVAWARLPETTGSK